MYLGVVHKTAGQKRTFVLDHTVLVMIKKSCFFRLPPIDSMGELVHLQVEGSVLL